MEGSVKGGCLLQMSGVFCLPPAHYNTPAPHQTLGGLWPNILETFSATLPPSLALAWPRATEDVGRRLTGTGTFEGHVILGAEQRSQPAHVQSPDFV